MGNSQGKELPASSPTQAQPASLRRGEASSSSVRPGSGHQRRTNSLSPPPDDSHPSGRNQRRSSRHDVSIFGISSHRDPDPADPMARRETKAEREARKLAKERELREKERERSLKEEGVDGGYLVTMGVYTGSEDFSKPIVRQLQLERRLAPFWRGLNDFSDMWTEHQIIAAANGLPIPPPDATPTDEPKEASPRSSDMNVHHLTVPIPSRSPSFTSDHSNLSPSHPAFSLPSPPSPFGSPPSSTASPFFRGRAKTLASLTSTSRNNSQQDMAPQETQLPKDPFVNGQRLEVFLYKDASECPICFMHYPPYLNKTRCCDQPICSECFVQIKRPDPHPPEHGDPNDPNASQQQQEQQEPQEPHQDYLLVSEAATCPFCKTPEFGITYDPPPFRRGLTYAHNSSTHPLASAMSAMSSSSSLNSQGPNCHSRRRTTSLGANEPSVVTTDKIRPDWAKKLSDARAHALRRAAAATALHNAAYVLGSTENSGRFSLGRRRRTIFGADSPSGSGPDLGSVGALLAAAERHGSQGGGGGSGGSGRSEPGSQDLFPGRHSSRRTRVEDLEELMMMEAIRLSLAAEEERKRKEEKEAEKQKKKDEKQKAKEQKKAEKAAKKSGLYPPGRNASNFSDQTGESSTAAAGKGKSVNRSGNADSNAAVPTGLPVALNELTSTIGNNADTKPKEDPQKHLEESRAQIGLHGAETSQGSANPPTSQLYHRHNLRQMSNASSSASSLAESPNLDSPINLASSFEPSPNASGVNLSAGEQEFRSNTPGGGAGVEPMFNFRSLAAVIGREGNDETSNRAEHIENARPQRLPTTEADSSRNETLASGASNPFRDNVMALRPRATDPQSLNAASTPTYNQDSIQTGPELTPQISNPYDAKHYGDVSVLEGPIHGQR